MSDAQSLLDETVSSIGTYRADIDTAIQAFTAFRPGYFTPTAETMDPLDSVSDVASAVIGRVTPTSVGLTNPSNNQYQPLASVSMPSYARATFSAEPANAFAAQIQALVPKMFDDLQAQVSAQISSGGSNIGAAIQKSVFDQGYERNQQILRDALDLAGARTGAKGCRYPNSMTKAMQQQIVSEYTSQRNDLSRQITQTYGNMVQENLKTAIAAGVSLDEARVSIFTQTRNALADVQRLALEQYAFDLRANLQDFEGGLQLQLADMGLQRADREEMRAFLSAQREQMELENRVNVSEFEANAKAEYMRVETDRMIRELTTSKNEQMIRAFAAKVQQQVELQRQIFADTQHQNDIAVGILENTAKAYTGLVQSMGSQAVAIVTRKT